MRKKWWAVFFVSILLLVGCNQERNMEKAKEVTVEPEQVEEEIEEETDEAAYHFPLTGVGSEEAVDGRTVAVVINNHPQARPQSGIGQADIVYELLAEGNVTRFLALFQSEEPDNIGPVRSARDYFIELAKGYDSFFIAHGYSPNAYALLTSGYIDHINGMQYDGSLFKRDRSRKAPHNSYITYDNIVKGAGQRGYDMDRTPSSLVFLTEDEQERLAGERAEDISISYHHTSFNSSFSYDDSLQKYKRYVNGKSSVDAQTNEPLLVDNVFVVEAEHKILDDEGRRHINVTSGGSGYLFQKGKKLDVEWRNIDGKILPYSDGKAVGFIPGKTWINVVPNNRGLDQDVTFQ